MGSSIIAKVLDAEHVPQKFFALTDTPHDVWRIKIRWLFFFTKWIQVRVRFGADVKKYIGERCRFHRSEICT